MCAEYCSSDTDCEGHMKCCYNGCGHECMEPYKAVSNMELSVLCLLTLALAFVPQLSATSVPIPRPGCPPYTFSSPLELRFCFNECTTDRNCRDNKICCFDGCSHLCVPRRRCKRCPDCTDDSQCGGDLKCCSNPCGPGKTCLKPEIQQGNCPKPNPQPGCCSPNECSHVRPCPPGYQCCDTGCGLKCFPVFVPY
uniref:WAP domain-containing protein n=1 Tax=Knipowitschia caucasica TaxID=637954 RepID=A0AAV2LXZ6_KNICA